MSVKTLLALVLVPLVLVACGGDKTPAAGPGSSAAAGAGAAAPAAEPKSPAEIGDAAAALYTESLKGLVDMLKDKPEAATVKAKVEAFREGCIQKFVALGRKREALPVADRATVDARIANVFNTISGELFSAYAGLQSHYAPLDQGFGDLVKSFNILTQYACFDLLKKQEPKEAERLGVK